MHLAYSLIAPEIMAVVLVERTMVKNFSGTLTCFLFKTCAAFSIVLAPTWLSYHVSAIKE